MQGSTEQRSQTRGAAYAPAWLTLVAGMLASVSSAHWFWQEAQRQDQARFDAGVANLVERLDTRTERYAEQLERFTDWIEQRPDVTPSAWDQYLKRLAPSGNLPALVELSYQTNLLLRSRADIDRDVPTRRIGASGKPVLAFIEKPPPVGTAYYWGNHPASDSALLNQWLNEPAIGGHWWATLNARMISSPRRLLVATNGASLATVSYFLPVFTTDYMELREILAQNHLAGNRFQGLIVGVIDWARLTSDLVNAHSPIGCEAFAGAADGEELTGATWMGSAGKMPAALEPGFTARFRKVQAWPFYRRQWRLHFYSTAVFEQASTRSRAWLALGGGAALSLMVFGLLATQIRARRVQEEIAGDLRLALAELHDARKDREQLNHDLHDGTIQSLYALQLGLSRTAAAAAGSPHARARLEEHRVALTAVIDEVRGFILRHETERGPTGDLAGALEALAQRLALSTETQVRADLSPVAARRLNGLQAVHLANLAREALSNALRHAQARTVTISLRSEAEAVVLEICDDGVGFEAGRADQPGLGLKTMASRAESAGGKFELATRPAHGTTIRVTLPPATS